MSRRRRKKLPTEPVKVTIDRLSHEGRGIAQIEGKTIFIDGGLPGEEVMFVYTSRRAKLDEGRVVEVIKAADDRVEPPCPHFNVCGGCRLQHMSVPAQIALKQSVLIEQFKHLANIEIDNIIEPLTDQTLGYRRKARLGVRYVIKKEKLLVGFREKNGGFLTDMNSCPVLDDSVGQRIEALQHLIGDMEAYNKIAQIEVAVGDNTTVLVFRNLEPLSELDTNALISFGEENNICMWIQPAGPDSAIPLNDSYPTLSYDLPDDKLTLNFLPTDFTQVNAGINRKMITRAIDALQLSSTTRVLDLFCGIGNFSLALAKHCEHVIGIEGSEALVVRARENSELNNIANIEFIAADLTEGLPEAVKNIDCLLLDPPRSGALEIVSCIGEMAPQRIVYISCNIATLARDTAELVAHGYRLCSAGIMDMFPHTAHVESMAVFEKI